MIAELPELKMAYSWHGYKPENEVAVIIHGIMGNKKNWAGFSDRLAAHFPNVSFLTVDLRNHGESDKHVEPYTIDACADDIVALGVKLSVNIAHVIGHSFGGKVALLVAEKLSTTKTVWVLDAPLQTFAVKALDKRDGLTAFHIMDILKDAPPLFFSRRELVDFMKLRGAHESIALWMTTNLAQQNEGYALNFVPAETYKMLTSFVGSDLWPLINDLSSSCRIHLVKAERGERIDDETPAKLRDLAGQNGFFHVVPRASHFLHVDNPQGLIEVFEKNGFHS